MKKYFNQPIALCMSVLLLLSCAKAKVDPNTAAGTTPAALTAALTTGNWTVSSYTQRAEDKTSKFTGILFVFSPNGTVTATKDGTSTSGTWQFTPAVTYYGSSSKSAIALNLGDGNPLRLLAKTWNLASSTSSTLKIDSPEIAEDEHVQFSKE